MEWFLTLGFSTCAWMWAHVNGVYLSFTTFGITLACLIALASYCIAKEGWPTDEDDIMGMFCTILFGSALIPLGLPYVLVVLACAFVGGLPLILLMVTAGALGYGAFHKDKVYSLVQDLLEKLK